MLSEELQNLALWMRTRQTFRTGRYLSCDPVGVKLATERLEELAEQADRLEAGTRLTGEERAERVSIEGIR